MYDQNDDRWMTEDEETEMSYEDRVAADAEVDAANRAAVGELVTKITRETKAWAEMIRDLEAGVFEPSYDF